MSLADYLAKNYLTADSDKKSKKRKRKTKEKDLVIADDDITGWKQTAESDDEDAPTIVGSTANLSLSSLQSAKKKSKSKSSTTSTPWTTFGTAAPSTAQQLAADTAAADAIIASTALDRQRALDAEDEAPQIIDTDGNGAPKMESGASAGLQSAAQVAAQEKKKADDEARAAAAVAKENPGETIYRDASGRIINVAMKRAEARRKAEEEEAKKRDAEKAARGDVQNALAAQRREKLKDAKTMNVARYADDVELNEELKEQGRWNDPAMGFLKTKRKGKSVTGKPLYEGSFEPNRYGIRPGHRWDGVDRSNGFEREWFKSRNRRKDVERLEYAWQMDE